MLEFEPWKVHQILICRPNFKNTIALCCKMRLQAISKLFLSFSFNTQSHLRLQLLFPLKIIISFYSPIKTPRKKKPQNKKVFHFSFFLCFLPHSLRFALFNEWKTVKSEWVRWCSSKMIVNIFIGRIWLETGFIRTHLKKRAAERNEYTHKIMWV